MTRQMHLAAQYLAAAGISFIEKKDDDSHTNLGFSITDKKMTTHQLSKNGDVLALQYSQFALEWTSKHFTDSLPLDGVIHDNVLNWISTTAIKANIKKKYQYSFHYELPYPLPAKEYAFTLTNQSKLEELVNYRILAQQVLDSFLKSNQLKSDIRIWPHHFDLGAFAQLNDSSEIAIGIGLGIPDTLVNEYYFYISAYKGHEGLVTNGFSSLTKGKWYNNGFKGALLPISNIDKSTALLFFNEALNQYKTTQ